MDDSNLTMKEYVKLEAEKASKHGQTFNWETATYGKLMVGTIFSRQVNRVHVLDFEGLADEMKHAFMDGSRMEMETNKFRAYSNDNSRDIATKAVLSDYWSRIAFYCDFLGVVPSYTSIWDPLRRLCHRLIAFNIFKRGQALEKVTATNIFYLRSIDEGMAVVAAEAAQANHEIPQEGVQADPAPVQAPQVPLTTLGPRTMRHRIQILEEKVHGLRESFGEQRTTVDAMSKDFRGCLHGMDVIACLYGIDVVACLHGMNVIACLYGMDVIDCLHDMDVKLAFMAWLLSFPLWHD
nr:hypothetical protein [Tanacetum cinerariifolium]